MEVECKILGELDHPNKKWSNLSQSLNGKGY